MKLHTVSLILTSLLLAVAIFFWSSSGNTSPAFSSLQDDTNSPSSTIQPNHQHEEKKNLCPIQSERRKKVVPAKKSLTFRLYAWYGLTNQMLSYASALRMAMDEQRSVLFPSVFSTNSSSSSLDVVPFHELFNAPLTFEILRRCVTLPGAKNFRRAVTQQELNQIQKQQQQRQRQQEAKEEELLTLVLPSAFPFTSMNKKHLYLPNRDAYRSLNPQKDSAVAGASVYMKKLHEKSSRYNFTRHHNFFMRYPWSVSALSSPIKKDPTLHEAFFLNALQPVDSIERYWFFLTRAISKQVSSQQQCASETECEQFLRRHVFALHLRLEKDAALLNKNLPTESAENIIKWFRSVLIPHLLEKNKRKSHRLLVVYLCIGSFPSLTFEQEMIRFAEQEEERHRESGIKIRWRSRVLDINNNIQKREKQEHVTLPTSFGSQRLSHQKSRGIRETQDHFMSFVEFLILVRSHSCILTKHSSLKFAVFSRRCYPTAPTEKIRKELECLLRPHQFVDTNEVDDEREIFLLNFDEKAGGKISTKLEKIRCSERTKGFAGHRAFL